MDSDVKRKDPLRPSGSSASPLVVGIGGTTRDQSSSERALQHALAAAEQDGARTACFRGRALLLPFYDPGLADRTPDAIALVEALRAADGVILASPGYHGSVSGLVKNALDYTEDLRDDDRPYLKGRAVGCIAVASGWQAAVNALRTLRDIVHALRGVPTPYGATLCSGGAPDAIADAATLVGRECAELARGMSGSVRLGSVADPKLGAEAAVRVPGD